MISVVVAGELADGDGDGDGDGDEDGDGVTASIVTGEAPSAGSIELISGLLVGPGALVDVVFAVNDTLEG